MWVKDGGAIPSGLSDGRYSVWNFQGHLWYTLHSDMAAMLKFSIIYICQPLLYECALWAGLVLKFRLMKCRWSECRETVSSRLCGWASLFFLLCSFTWLLDEEKKNRVTHVAYHWQEWEFRLPITDCCLPCARPQRPLLSLDPQTAPGLAAGMDCNGMHYSADRGRTFKSGAEFFIPWYVLIA